MPDSEFLQKWAELNKLFETLPAITLTGVVDASGASGGKSKDDILWKWGFTLLAWRPLGRPVQTRPLSVVCEVTEEEMKLLRGVVNKDSVVTFTAKLCENSPFGFPKARFISVLPATPDPELEQILQEATKEVVFSDPDLGLFTLNRSLGWFEGQLPWLGEPILLYVDLWDEEEYPQKGLQIAKTLQTNMGEWTQKTGDYAAKTLLETKNERWLEDDEEPLQPAEFIQRLSLQSLTIYCDGSFEFSFDDGDLFWGHSINVSGSLAEGLTDASF